MSNTLNLDRLTGSQSSSPCCTDHLIRGTKSSSSLSCDSSIASSKLSSPKSAILSFLLQLRVDSCFLKVIQQLLTPSSPSNLSFNDVFQKAVPTQYVPNPVGLVQFPFNWYEIQHYRRGIIEIHIRTLRGSVVGWGTMLQAGRSPVRVSEEVDFF
jgi:hypothetical protein